MNAEPTILFISLGVAIKALVAYKLKEKTLVLAKKCKNFIYSPVWPYYTDAIAAMEKCSVIATDSGSIQEETNLLNIPGVVLRFKSDRPEAIFSGSNILSPPINKEVVFKIISQVADDNDLNTKMGKSPKLYNERMSEKIISTINRITMG